jgi:hypothetical protein
MSSDADMQPLISDFLKNLKAISQQLQKSCASGDMAKTQTLVANVSESGKGYGFAPLSEVGQSVLRLIHTPDAKPLDVRRAVERMISVIGRCAA